jgi:hypothetical protein
MIYLGFTIEQMINFLNKNCRSFVLVTNDVEEMDGDFRLTVYSDEHGEYEGFGFLSRLVIEAFKPFVTQAKLERENNKKTLSEILSISQD